MAKKIVRLTESDLTRIIRRVIKEQSSGNKLIGQKYAFYNVKTKEKLVGAIEKIYPAKGTEAPSYSQILLVNFDTKGKMEIGFDCRKTTLYCPSLNAQLYTDAGVEEYLSTTYCK